MKIGQITSSAEYQMAKQLQNCQFLEPNFVCQIEIILEIC